MPSYIFGGSNFLHGGGMFHAPAAATHPRTQYGTGATAARPTWGQSLFAPNAAAVPVSAPAPTMKQSAPDVAQPGLYNHTRTGFGAGYS